MKRFYPRPAFPAIISLIVVFFVASLAYCQANYKICLTEDLPNATLRLFYDSGNISGYVIFRDQNGQMCAVDSNQIPLLICQGWKEPLDIIRPEKFSLLTLNNATKIFAYPIKPIPFSIPQDSSVKITFKLGDIEAVDQVGNYSRAELDRDLYQLPILYQDRKSKPLVGKLQQN